MTSSYSSPNTRASIEAYFKDPLSFPLEFKQWLLNYLEMNVPSTQAGAAVPSFGTTLPTSPSDKQQAILVDSLTAPNFTWLFRYNASSSSSFKWEFIGGAPLIGASIASVSNGATLNTWVNVVGTTIAVPRQGDYRMAGSGVVTHPSAGATSYIGIYVGAATTIENYGQFGFPVAGGYSGTIAVAPTRVNGCPAGLAVGMSGQSNTASGTFQLLGWEILPIRVL